MSAAVLKVAYTYGLCGTGIGGISSSAIGKVRHEEDEWTASSYPMKESTVLTNRRQYSISH